MCGISGFLSSDGEFGKDVLHEFNRIQGHRGPDNNDIYFDGFAGFAHQRLKIIDLSDKANQPMESHCKRYIIVYNGEVYNFKEVLKQIQIVDPGYKPHSTSDTEIVLQAFVVWKNEFVHKLNGMFAIAIYDKHVKKLHLFRDRIGIKPLYYCCFSNFFAFSSELKTLSKNSLIKKRLSLSFEALNQYMHLGYIPAPNSIYNEIKKLPPGSEAVFSDNKLNILPWWKPEDKITDSVISDEAEAIEILKDITESSVSQCLISDVPFGTFLSGGIDSSLVTAIAQKHCNKPVNTYSIAFSDSKYNEAIYAKKVASFLKTNHHEFIVSQKDALEWLPTLMDIYDEPFADSSALPTLLVSKLAKQHVTMTLSGDGGDELFMGYGSYKWARRLNSKLFDVLRHPAAIALGIGNSRAKRVSHLMKYPGKEYLKSHIFSQEQYFFARKELHWLLQSECFSAFELKENYTKLNRQLSAAESQALFDLKYYLPDDLLVKVDRASMNFGLETRVPLLDYRLVEFALNLDENLKTGKNSSKYLLKKLLFQYVPKEYFDRPKWGFAIPLSSWMKNELRDFVNDWTSEGEIIKHGVFNTEYVNKLKFDYFEKKHDYLYNRIWQVIIMQMWLNRE